MRPVVCIAMLFALLTGVFAQQIEQSNSTDPCSEVAKFSVSHFPGTLLPPSAVNRCMAEIPLNITAAEDALKGVTEMLDIYSYEFYEIDSKNKQLQAGVDILQSLQNLRIDLPEIKSFVQFSNRLSQAVNSLNDGHTEIAVECASRIAFDAFLPLALLAPTANSPAQVMVHPEMEQFFVDRRINNTEQFAMHKSLAGAKVERIDGQNALAYLIGLTNSSDILFGNIDPQTRFNQLFVNLRGTPTPRLGYGSALTSLSRSSVTKDSIHIEVTFGDGTTHQTDLPWYSMVDTQYSKVQHKLSFTDYYSKYVCMRGNVSELNVTSRASTVLFDPEYTLIRAAPGPNSPVLRNRVPMTNGTYLPSSKTVIGHGLELITQVDSGFSIFHFRNTSVGVIYLTNFYSQDSENSTMPIEKLYATRYRTQLQNGMKELKSRGVDTLLLEVAGNNGGRIELGSLFMLTMFPGQYPGFASVFRANNETYTYLNGSGIEESWIRPDGSRFASLEDVMMVNNATVKVNGIESSYTQLIVDDLRNSTNWPIIGNATFPQQNLFKPENMMIITNGKCASTCAQVTMYLQDVHGVKSVGFGGVPGSESLLQTVGGVRGSQVLEMLDEHNPAGNTYNLTMRVEQMTVNFRSAIHYEKHIPTEFVTRNVDYVYQHTAETYNSLSNTWQFVAETHFADAMARPREAQKQVDWLPLHEYPAGWFDRVLALQSAMDRRSYSF